MVVFDATTMLIFMFPDKVKPPIDKNTRLPVTLITPRIDTLIKQLKKDKTKIVIPSPAFSEMLVKAGDDTQALIDIINKDSVFRVEPFCTLAAVEVAIMARSDPKGDRNSGADKQVLTYAKLKYDRQIVAIAKVHRAKAIYSDDEHIYDLCRNNGIRVIRTEDLPIPKDEAQEKIDFPDKEAMEESVSDSQLERTDYEEGLQEEATD